MTDDRPPSQPVVELPRSGSILAVDWGEKRIGLATSDETQIIAHPLGVLTRRAGRRFPLKRLKEYLDTYESAGLLLGLPLTEDGEEESTVNGSVALRGTFLIDEEGVVWHATVNNEPLGRNIDETLRYVDALSFHQKHGEVCPAGWEEGDDAMEENFAGIASYLEKNADQL